MRKMIFPSYLKWKYFWMSLCPKAAFHKVASKKAWFQLGDIVYRVSFEKNIPEMNFKN